MSLLETFICSLETEKGVVITPNAYENNPGREAETPFTVLFDLTSGKFTNDVGGDFVINARATNVSTPFYIFTINDLPIGTWDSQQSGDLEIRNGNLVDTDGKIRTVVNGFNATADSFYEFLTSEEFCNIDPSSQQSFTVKAYVFESRKSHHFNIFPTSLQYNSAVSVGSIKVKIATDDTDVLTGELTEAELIIPTERQITTEELSQLDLTNATGFFKVRIGGEIIDPTPPDGQSSYEIDNLIGVEAEINAETGEFRIISINELTADNQAGVTFEANHSIDVDGTIVNMQVRRTYVITVNSSYQDPTPPSEDLGILYDEIGANLSISPYGICKFNYNFHIERYESHISTDSISHNLLPCFYNNVFYLNNREKENSLPLNGIESLISLNNSIPISETTNLLIPSTTELTQEQEYSLEKYYNKYGVVLSNNLENEILQNQGQTMSYKFIYDTEYRKFLNNDSYKRVFPFYNEISFPKAKTGDYGKLMEKHKKCDDFKIINELFSEIPETPVLFDGVETRKRVKVANLLGEESLYGNQSSENEYVFYADPEETNTPSLSQSSYIENFGTYQLLDKIIKNKIIKKENDYIKFQNDLFQELYESEMATIGGQSEVLFYKIKKYQDVVGQEPISTICIPNVSELPKIAYVDTQVKANKDYHYVIDAIILCRSSTSDNYYLLQEEVTRVRNVTLNNPPMPIDYSILPYLGENKENNKIRIKMNQSVGHGYHEIVTLDDEEAVRAERIKVSQGRDGQGEESITSKKGYELVYSREKFEDTIYFENDDPIKVYEIYRLESPPISVQDFSKATVHRTVDSFYEDTLEYNKEYYYMVRGIDSHGNISNPSPVLRVTIIDEGNRYSVIRPYDYDEYPERKYNTIKKMRKFMRIRPLPASMLVSEQQGEYTIGAENSEPWGKDYKIRVTSNTSGKMMDINFKFTRVNSLGNETN